MQSYVLHVILQNTVHSNPNLLSQFHRVLKFILAPVQYRCIHVCELFVPSFTVITKKDGCWLLLEISPWKSDTLEIICISPPPKCYMATEISEAKDHKVFHTCNAPKVSSTSSGTRTLYFCLFILVWFCLVVFFQQQKTICL